MSRDKLLLVSGVLILLVHCSEDPLKSRDISGPEDVTDLTASASGPTSVVLSWQAPFDSGELGRATQYDIRYSTSDISDSDWDDGLAECQGEPDPKSAGEDETFEVTGLQSATKYYFALKSTDEYNNVSALSNVASVTTVPSDVEPPPPVTGFMAVAGDGQVKLRWTNPAVDDIEGVVIRYSVEGYPDTVTSGRGIDADGILPAEPASADSFTHSGLTNGTTYYYSIFTFDEVPNYSQSIHEDATPGEVDETPPPPVTSFTAVAGDGHVKLRWTNPAADDLEGVMIRFSDQDYPDTVTSGEGIDADGILPAEPATADSFTHTGLVNGTTYYY
jgi:hypothetical protein